MSIEIRQLCECPQHLQVVGMWIYEQWWRTPDNSPEVVLSLLRKHIHRDSVPFTLVALDDGVPVGSCCVVENDCVHRPQYSPWVAAVYVQEDRRHQGIASRLVQEACRVAGSIGITDLFLDCHLSTAPLYERNGWHIFEREVGDPYSVVMCYTIE